MAELIAPSTVAANSADFTVVAGTETCIALKPAVGGTLPNDAMATLFRKSTGGDYSEVAKLASYPLEARVLTWLGAGTYRLTKHAAKSGGSFGADRD